MNFKNSIMVAKVTGGGGCGKDGCGELPPADNPAKGRDCGLAWSWKHLKMK